MRIAHYYPSQISPHATLFCEYTGYEFLDRKCDANTDLIYAGSVSALAAALHAKQKFNKPLICWCWDIPYNWREWRMSKKGLERNAQRDTKNDKNVSLLRKCDLVMTGSKWTQKILKTQYNISSEQIYSYIDVDSIDAVPMRKKTKQIIQISRYFYNKRFEDTIQASRDLTDYKVVFIGFSSDPDYCEELRKSSAKYDREVTFRETISREDVITNLRRSTVLTSPSAHEGFGVSPIEALYCKVPVLLSNLEVFQEIYGDSVLYHELYNPEDMKEKLEHLVADKELQKKIVDDCQLIISEFTPMKFAQRWKKVVK